MIFQFIYYFFFWLILAQLNIRNLDPVPHYGQWGPLCIHGCWGPLVRPLETKERGRGSVGEWMPFVGTAMLTFKLNCLYYYIS